MKTITIHTIPGFDEWRDAARQCLMARVRPEDIQWQEVGDAQNTLFEENDMIFQPQTNPPHVPKLFIDMAATAICHVDPCKYALLYCILWRLTHENKNLLSLPTDDDVRQLLKMVKEVRRDAYKITAFLRFRETLYNGQEYFIAWYEPEHYSLELKLDFFKTRFKNMRWSILTPYRAAHWDMQSLVLEDNPDPSLYPKHDQIEEYWVTYYASIFNPARLKTKAMKTQMPKKYWKNMPETKIIESLVRASSGRTKTMIEKSDRLSLVDKSE